MVKNHFINKLTFEIENIQISRHAKKRLKERFGKFSDRTPKLAIERGLPGFKTTGNLRDWLESQYFKYAEKFVFNIYYIYNNSCFVFNQKGILITILNIPENLTKSSVAQIKRYNQNQQ